MSGLPYCSAASCLATSNDRIVRTRLANRDTVLQAALDSNGILAAFDFQPRALAKVSLEALAIVADVLDNANDPVSREPDGLTEFALGAEKSLGLGIILVFHPFDVRLGHAEFLGIQHGVVGPADDVAPVIVAVANGRAERLLRDDFRQNDVVVRV